MHIFQYSYICRKIDIPSPMGLSMASTTNKCIIKVNNYLKNTKKKCSNLLLLEFSNKCAYLLVLNCEVLTKTIVSK